MLASPNAHHHQIAYVTNDMDKALEVFARDYNVTSSFTLSDGRGPALPGGLRMRIALANVNGVELELIQPMPDSPKNLYSDVLPEDGHFVLVFHHICSRIDGPMENWDRHRASLDETVHPIAFEGALGDVLRFVYTDERDRLGHYLEHVWMAPEILDQMAKNVPNHPA